MVAQKKQGGLTEEEKRIVKALLAKGLRNQDIQALVNTGREATINSGRITGVKQDGAIVAASDEEVEFFNIRKASYDPKTGLNLFDHERLIRSREAMILAVQVFNSPALRFKSEVFTMLAHVAWTYLLHEHYERRLVSRHPHPAPIQSRTPLTWNSGRIISPPGSATPTSGRH